MIERNRYKVLPLPSPYRWELDDEDLDDILNTGDIETNPVFFRDGWYYDRLTGKSWVETKYGCFENRSAQMFKYELGLMSHSILPQKVVAAIEVLNNYNVCPKNLLKALWKDEEVRHLINIRRNAFKHRYRFEKEYEFKEKESKETCD